MDKYLHGTMASVVSARMCALRYQKQRVYAKQSEAKILKKIIILGPRSAILGPQFCRNLVLGPHYLGSGELRPLDPLDSPLLLTIKHCPTLNIFNGDKQMFMEFLVMEWKGVVQMKKTSSCRLGSRAYLRALEALEF